MFKAYRGYDGKELWSVDTYGHVFEINCEAALNGDGHNDCVLTGRLGMCTAVDPITGARFIIMHADPLH